MITVDSPVNCKLFLKFKKDNSYEMKELMLTQVFNYKISENKRPVYGFNKLDYEQVVRGKRLFEGVIAIKKSLISDISKYINLGSPTEKDKLKYQEAKIEYLKNILDYDKSINSKLEEYYKRIMEEYRLKLEEYTSNNHADILNALPDDTSLVIGFGSYKTTDDFKEQYKNMINKENLTSEDLERLIQANSEFVVESVNFFEKTGEINISKNDIDEVYKFFGKLKTWRDL